MYSTAAASNLKNRRGQGTQRQNSHGMQKSPSPTQNSDSNLSGSSSANAHSSTNNANYHSKNALRINRGGAHHHRPIDSRSHSRSNDRPGQNNYSPTSYGGRRHYQSSHSSHQHHQRQSSHYQHQPPPQLQQPQSPQSQQITTVSSPNKGQDSQMSIEQFVYDKWLAVQKELEQKNPKVIYYTELSNDTNSRDFKAFGMDLLWGKRLVGKLTLKT